MNLAELISREWLEPDGIGGFASGTAAGIRTRRYHALLLCGEQGPSNRRVLVNGFDLRVSLPDREVPVSSQAYAPGVIAPDGATRIVSFTATPWPTWEYDLGNGCTLTQELVVPRGFETVVLAWRLRGCEGAGVRLRLRPFLSGRDYHALHLRNTVFRFASEASPLSQDALLWRPYGGLPGVQSRAEAEWTEAPHWYQNFEYIEEARRGLDFLEDLGSPGEYCWDMERGFACWVLSREGTPQPPSLAAATPGCLQRSVSALFAEERARREAFPNPLERAADAYVVRRGAGTTIIAGYPWFTDWGRDTFIALRGLCLSTGRIATARDILLSWTSACSEGMLPNRFPDSGEAPEYNSVDASLWFIVAVHELIEHAAACEFTLSESDLAQLRSTVLAILDGYSRGTRHGIRLDEDGLLAAGEPGVQLTWMDAKVGNWVVTPRCGKPVEIQALWLNALWIALQLGEGRFRPMLDQGLRSFQERFWNDSVGALHDVVDVDHVRGRIDSSFRPNQIFAVGGLPLQLIGGDRASSIVRSVEARLLTPLGLRSLDPQDDRYHAAYEGGVHARDGAYHQGTVWPWLIGAYVEAWLRVQEGEGDVLQRAAAERFLQPLLAHLDHAGLGHISEIADGAAPNWPRGCPWQAWSVAEVLRLTKRLTARPKTPAPAKRKSKPSPVRL